jgi:hypothetical protein
VSIAVNIVHAQPRAKHIPRSSHVQRRCAAKAAIRPAVETSSRLRTKREDKPPTGELQWRAQVNAETAPSHAATRFRRWFTEYIWRVFIVWRFYNWRSTGALPCRPARLRWLADSMPSLSRISPLCGKFDSLTAEVAENPVFRACGGQS